MRIWLLTALLFCGTAKSVADNGKYTALEPLKLEVPELKIEMPSMEKSPSLTLTPEPSYQLTWMRTNPDVKEYKVMDDLTFVGVPLFLAGMIAKSEKKAFRQNDGSKHVLLTEFKTRIDDYTQFFGPVMTVGLKAAGVEGRSDWGRLLSSAGMSYAFMAAFVNGIKYTAKEMRPDGSTANSWPSGHTATAFVGATILHKEYGMTRSPWYSVAGYGMATATGVMRVLNNRHWVSDVLSGAGIGIMSGELAYALSDVFFKKRGLLRGDISSDKNIIYNPSFFSVSMGLGGGSRDLTFDLEKFELEGHDEGDTSFNLKFGASTVVGLEGAYFFNKYIGVGGRLRVNSSPIKGWDGIEMYALRDLALGLYGSDYESGSPAFQRFIDGVGEPGQPDYSAPLVDELEFTIKSDHLTEFTVDLGVYFNYPLSNRFALGSKLLVGRSIMQEIDLNARASGGQRDLGFEGETDYDNVTCLPSIYNSEWDYFTVGGNNTMKFGTGLSLTYAYKENYAWRLFLDYDFSRKTYTMTYCPGGFMVDACTMMGVSLREWGEFIGEDLGAGYQETLSIKKNRHTFILGGSFTISF